MVDIWEQIVYDLNGTCNSLIEVLDNHNCTELEDDEAFLSFLDSEIFLCSGCNWWYPVSEESGACDGELVCYDCAEER